MSYISEAIQAPRNFNLSWTLHVYLFIDNTSLQCHIIFVTTMHQSYSCIYLTVGMVG